MEEKGNIPKKISHSKKGFFDTTIGDLNSVA